MAGGRVLFRRRMAWLYLAFITGVAVGYALHRALPEAFAPLVGVLSLPAPYLVDPAPTPPRWAPLYIVPAAFVLASYALRAWATGLLSFSVVGDRDLRTQRLVVAGPYRVVRNPLYLGLLLLAVGTTLLAPPPALLLAVAAVWPVLARLARIEERHLSAAQPGYAEYAANVRPFLPRLSPWRPPPNVARPRPDWVDGLVGEGWHLALLVPLLLMATPARALAVPVGAALVLLWGALLRARRMRFPAA